MKKVIVYEDNDGRHWNTEHEALMSDYRIALQPVFNKYTMDSGDFDLDDWMESVKKDPEIIDALLHFLEVNLTDIQAERLVKTTMKKDLCKIYSGPDYNRPNSFPAPKGKTNENV